MGIDGRRLAALLAVVALVGCDGGTRGMTENTQQRGIDADIAASRDHGPTALQPGMTVSQEPAGAFPWDMSGSRQ